MHTSTSLPKADATAKEPFTAMLRRLRVARQLSQLQLALQADISQRHLSYLETGRSRPSREMVARLAVTLDVGLREHNALLIAAGYAPAFAARPLAHPDMDAVNAALDRMLDHQMPYPALVIDKRWNVIRSNPAMSALIGLLGNPDALWAATCPGGQPNVAYLTVHPAGLRPHITNARQVIPEFLRRLHREALEDGGAELLGMVEALDALAGPAYARSPQSPADHCALAPVIPLSLEAHGHAISLFSMLTTFGTPQDVTTDELRIELFYPADTASRDLLEQLGSA